MEHIITYTLLAVYWLLLMRVVLLDDFSFENCGSPAACLTAYKRNSLGFGYFSILVLWVRACRVLENERKRAGGRSVHVPAGGPPCAAAAA